MKAIAKVQLLPDARQRALLVDTLERANAACNAISAYAWTHGVFGQYQLHQALYHTVRRESGLSAQMVVRCAARVAAAYKLDRHSRHQFDLHSPIPYDERILTWWSQPVQVTLWTLGGREGIQYACSSEQRRLLSRQQGESDLIFFQDRFYLFTLCNVEDVYDMVIDVSDVLDIGSPDPWG
jgi:putative transposase